MFPFPDYGLPPVGRPFVEILILCDTSSYRIPLADLVLVVFSLPTPIIFLSCGYVRSCSGVADSSRASGHLFVAFKPRSAPFLFQSKGLIPVLVRWFEFSSLITQSWFATRQSSRPVCISFRPRCLFPPTPVCAATLLYSAPA